MTSSPPNPGVAARSASTPVAWPGLMLAVGGAIAFSGKAIVAKLLYRHGQDAVQVLFWRMLLALPFFLLLAWWAGRGKAPLPRRDRALVVLLGFCGYYLASFFDFLGLQYISAGLERLILYLNPTLVLLLGWLALGKRITRRQGLCLALSYAGVLLVFGQEARLQGANVALGTLLVFVSAVSYAVYLVISGEAVQRIGALRLTGLASSVACLLCIAQFFVLKPLGALAVSAPVAWLSLLNATVCTVAPVLMVMMAIERLGAPLAAQVGMIGPMSTLLLAALVLDEPFTGGLLAGTALVLAGIWLLARR